jgi:peroxiredoxin
MMGWISRACCAIATLACSACAWSVAPGSAVPDCILTDIGGASSHDLREFRGKVLYVDFWASWCTSCAKSFPFLNALDHDLRARGLQVLGINLDERPQDARAFLAGHPADFALAADHQGTCPRRFGVTAMPSTYLVDRQGTVRHVHLGFHAADADALRVRVESLLAEPDIGP